MKDKSFEQLDADLEVLESLGRYFFSSSLCSHLSKDDKDDVMQWARIILFKHPYDASRRGKSDKPVSREGYFKALYPLALKTWSVNRQLRTEALSQFEARNDEIVRKHEAESQKIKDPLRTSNQIVRDLGGIFLFDMPGQEGLRPAPHKVTFSKNVSCVHHRHCGIYFPWFVIEPKDRSVLAVATHGSARGRRRKFGKRDLPTAVVEQLEKRTTMMGVFLRELIPIYLSNFGFKSLDRKYWTMIADINKRGWTPGKIQAKRRITHSAYYAQLYALRRRGWIPTWSESKNREILMYSPAYDRCKSFYSDMMLDLEKEISIGSIVDLAGPVIEEQLYQEELSETLIRKELRLVRKRLLESTRDMTAEEDYDAKIRAFIVDFVERPIKTEMPIEEIEERFRRLPTKRRLAVFCEAIRLRCSIYDVLDLDAAFADELYDPEGIPDAKPLTLQSVFGLKLTSAAA